MKKKDILEEERKTIEALGDNWMGIVDIMGISGVGYYHTLQILDTLIKQGAVEKKQFGAWDKYRKIDKIGFEGDNDNLEEEVSPEVPLIA